VADALHTAELSVVGIAWLLFALTFLLHARSLRTGVRVVGDRRSLIGFALQIAGYVIVRAGLRSSSDLFLPWGTAGEIASLIVAVVVLGAALVSISAAVRVLGRQWSLAARVVEGHELVTSGVYGVVRHPIYTGMLGMLLGTALAVSSWWALIVGALIFLVGTALRVRVEERLLVAQFGDAYRDYAQRVPALIPRLHRA
jgi:protein-S-isoprenylcysteine O-methyltransferase Ste14